MIKDIVHSFLFFIGDIEKKGQKGHVHLETLKMEVGAVPFDGESEVLKSPVETVADIKANDRLLEKSSEVGPDVNSVSSSFSVTSSDSDLSNVKTCSITDINHVPVVTVKDVQNLIISPKSKSESGSESMPDVRAILSSTPELETSMTNMSARNSRLNKGSKDDLKTSLNFENVSQELVNTNSLFAELSSQEPSVIGEIDEGAEISVMGKELESVLKENEELVKTK